MATTKKTAPTKHTDNKVLYTIRLEQSIITKLNAKAKKLKTTHAAVAREILHAGV